MLGVTEVTSLIEHHIINHSSCRCKEEHDIDIFHNQLNCQTNVNLLGFSKATNVRGYSASAAQVMLA